MGSGDQQHDELYLVDGSGYIFRAYFALPQNLTNPEGVPVGAVLGFTNMLIKLVKDIKAPYLAVIFDAARRNFRYDLYDQYKANREDPPEDLIPQFPLFREATEAFGIPALEVEGYEADDLIATYAAQAVKRGQKVTIVGTDKDLMQLVNDHVRLYDPIKGKYLGTEDVIEKFGVPPAQVVDVQALAGDSVDNVPGVPGIGVKTAAQLISEYGSLETLLDRAGEIKQNKRRETLLEHKDKAILSKKLVTLAADAPVPLNLEDLKSHEPDHARLTAFLQKQGFRSILNRFGENSHALPAAISMPVTSDTAKPVSPALIDRSAYVLINTVETLSEWVKKSFESGRLAIDTETTHLTPARAKLVGISLSYAPGQAAYIPIGHVQVRDLLGSDAPIIPQLSLETVLSHLKPLLESPSVLKIGQNIKYDWQMFKQNGINISPYDDTMLLSYTLDGTSHSNGMDELSRLFLQHTPIPYEDVAGKGKSMVTFDQVDILKAKAYAAEDADITLRLYDVLKPRLALEHMARVYEDIERPIVSVIGQMEQNGIKIDRSVLSDLSQKFSEKLSILEQDIQAEARTEFNVGSPKQIGEILFDHLKLPGGTRTKTGQWSTDADVLETLAEQGHGIVQKILDWRGTAKLKSTYTDTLVDQINPATGRVHTSFSLAGTSTGRLSSSDPNLQNIPIRTEEGRLIRRAFVAEEGHVLLSVDYSQVELRLAAEMADVKALKQAFLDDVDIHAHTASQVFGVPLAEVTPELRRQAKAVNFGIIYGISGWGLAKQLGCEPQVANEFIRKYLGTFREIQDYMERTKAFARKHEYVTTLFGRKCFTPNINAKNGAWRAGAERAAINAPLQGTAADIMKMAMVKIPPALSAKHLSARMLLQVHDELIFEVPEAELSETSVLVKSVMENTVTLGVPLIAETGFGKSWAEAH
ncbi:MAG: DNA polymerase I [Alphaproteobacteria bacterium]|nr:DNA polymerase I [Alphaproteobacteria bacterium]